MKKTVSIISACIVLALVTTTAPCNANDPQFQLNGNAIQAHAEFLASDLLEGRAAGSRKMAICNACH